MQITRLYTGHDGQSHFEDIEVDLIDQGSIGAISLLWPGSGVMFRHVAGDYDYDFHTAPQRQLIANLDGEVDIELGSGEVRRFGAGSLMIAEDLTGQGHISRAVEGGTRTCLFIPLDGEPGQDLSGAANT
jgi:hypothetical protein